MKLNWKMCPRKASNVLQWLLNMQSMGIRVELVQSEGPAMCMVWMLGLQHQLFQSTDLFSLVGLLGAVLGSLKPPSLLS